MKLKPANLQNVDEFKTRAINGEIFYHNGVEFYHHDNGTLGGVFLRKVEGEDRLIYHGDCAGVHEWQVREKELEPCPFCGSKNIRVASASSYWVACDSCDAEGPLAKSEQEAIDKWNRRVEGNDNI